MTEVDELRVKVAALEAELRLARGEVKTVLNNTEQVKLNAEQAMERYERYMAEPRDEAWERELASMKRDRDYWHAKYCKLNSVIDDIAKLARRSNRYKLVEVDE